eukprot:234608_1
MQDSKQESGEILAYEWRFLSNDNLTQNFKNATKDQVLRSEKFIHDGCKFFLECTPNGFSESGSKEGECTLWLAVDSLPDGIGKLNITIRFVCNELNYDASRSSPQLGVEPPCSWSVGLLETLQQNQFRNISNWVFRCYVTIHEKIERKNDDQLLKLKLLLALLQQQQQEEQQQEEQQQQQEPNTSNQDEEKKENTLEEPIKREKTVHQQEIDTIMQKNKESLESTQNALKTLDDFFIEKNEDTDSDT